DVSGDKRSGRTNGSGPRRIDRPTEGGAFENLYSTSGERVQPADASEKDRRRARADVELAARVVVDVIMKRAGSTARNGDMRSGEVAKIAEHIRYPGAKRERAGIRQATASENELSPSLDRARVRQPLGEVDDAVGDVDATGICVDCAQEL